MKNDFSFSALGLIMCLVFPLICWLRLLDPTPGRGVANVLAALLSAPIGVCLALGAVWGVWGGIYNWKNAAEQERATFLRREQLRANNDHEPVISLFLFMLALSGVASTLVYSLPWFRKPPFLSFPLFVGVSGIFSFEACVAVLLWLNICDRKLRASRVVSPKWDQ